MTRRGLAWEDVTPGPPFDGKSSNEHTTEKGAHKVKSQRTLVRKLSFSTILALFALALPAALAFAHNTHVLKGTVGAGELSEPRALAVDSSSGNLYVTNLESGSSGKVRKFDSSGSPANFSALGTNGLGPFNLAISSEESLAVDNSGGVNAGDLYVAVDGTAVKAFKSSGESAPFSASALYLSGNEITGSPSGSFRRIQGVTVDANGDIYVAEDVSNGPDTDGVIDIYASSGQYVAGFTMPARIVKSLAVDSKGNVFVGGESNALESRPAIDKFTPSSFPVNASTQYGAPTTFYPANVSTPIVAVNSSDDIYVGDSRKGKILEFDEAGSPIAEVALLASFKGLAARGVGATERVYAISNGQVMAFGPLVRVSDATTIEASEVGNTTAKVSGIVNPDETEASYQFEYGTMESYGHKAPASPAAVGNDNADHPESVELTGLEPSTTYHFRVDGINECEAGVECVSFGQDESFRTAGPPTIDGSNVTGIAGAVATIKTNINPSGYETEYEIEYGTTEAYGSSGGAGTIGPRDELQILQVRVAHEGQYKLSFEGETTADIAFNASPATIQSALRALPAIGSGGVSVKSAPGNSFTLEYEIAFEGPLAKTDVPKLKVKPGTTSLGLGEGEVSTRIPGGLNSDQEAFATLTGLEPETAYYYRVLAANHCNPAEPAEVCPAKGESKGTFTTTAPLLIDSTSLTAVTTTEATLLAQINPEGTDTHYRFEYGTSESYGSSTEPTDVGSSTKDEEAKARISDLAPDTTYHFRVVATNSFAERKGPDRVFHTFAEPPSGADTCPNAALRAESNVDSATGWPLSAELPDCRAFEQVSLTGDQEVYVPVASSTATAEEDTATDRPFLASDDGHAVAYQADPSSSTEAGNGSTGAGAGNQYLASRGEDDWHAANIQPLGSQLGAQYEAFSPDLSRSVLEALATVDEQLLAPGAVLNCPNLYSRTSASSTYQALFSETQTPGDCGEPLFAGASADYSRLFFQTEASLIPSVAKASGEGANLYASNGGQLSLVNLLPKPSKAQAPNATFGSAVETPNGINPSFSNVVSADGTRAFWTNLATGKIYVREEIGSPSAETLQVSAGTATYWTATPDGRYAYYTEGGQLWRFDVQSKAREAIAGAGAEVQGVVGVNQEGEDGSYLYFVAEGVLAANKVNNGNGEEEAQAGQPNLYLRHEGTTSFIVTLAQADNEFRIGGDSSEIGGDWSLEPGHRTAELSPDGRHLGFRSLRPFTGYDNLSTGCGNGEEKPCPELFIYVAGSTRLSCVSCDPSGAPPIEASGGAEAVALDPASIHPTYMQRWITDDGRLFFDSNQPLVPADGNGFRDVYQWEPDEVGSCRRAGGCISLLSAAAAADASYLIEADESGENVFFATRAQLLPSDRDGKMDLYDARVDGGFPTAKESPSCEAEACRGPIPPPPPASQSPGSSTFSGPGNEQPKQKGHKKHRKKKSHKKHKRARGAHNHSGGRK